MLIKRSPKHSRPLQCFQVRGTAFMPSCRYCLLFFGVPRLNLSVGRSEAPLPRVKRLRRGTARKRSDFSSVRSEKRPQTISSSEGKRDATLPRATFLA